MPINITKYNADCPRRNLLPRALRVIAECRNAGADVKVFFTFTCAHCGERCMLAEPNMLYERGECDKCGKVTPIERGGFALHIGESK